MEFDPATGNVILSEADIRRGYGLVESEVPINQAAAKGDELITESGRIQEQFIDKSQSPLLAELGQGRVLSRKANDIYGIGRMLSDHGLEWQLHTDETI